MVKKKKTDVSFKTQLTVATGVVLLLVAFGLLVGWLDARYKLDVTVATTYSDVTIKGESACLPHKGDGPHTMECAQGVKTASGVYYAIDGVVDRNDNDNSVVVTGTLQPALADSTYDTAGTIKVE